ncbi:MAG: [acyl-carrier-protein] S-malonyltransferase [Candidatus Marinimicrobia bacterium]|nr:[acyl-carrier-protein] S-malonyltransferase [Candidatus Neomarinimicrobiota bacterium]|tara:strand:- start:332 stop:1246 length:915 start_codon:yes stop_codon:yes gene_type:complete
MKVALLCPGQGSQFVGMGKEFWNLSISSKEKYDNASQILGFDISEISFNGPDDKLKKTQYTQPAIFIHSYIAATELKNKYDIQFSIGAGHSLGEITALTIANSISFEDAVEIIKVRANSMAEAGNINPGKMAAIIGATNKQIDIICNQTGIIVPANLNAQGQVVISGEIDAVNSAIETAKSIGIRRVLPLNVSGAFHSPLMSSARENLLKVINSTHFKDSDFPIIQNVTAEPAEKSDEIKKNLISQLENPVRWSQSIEKINDLGIIKFIECGPGKVLSGLNRRILKKSINFNIGTPQEINEFKA